MLVPACYTPLDIAIAPNGQFAVVPDGRSLLMPPQSPTNMIGILDLVSFTYTATYTLTTANGAAQAVAVAADNQTVIIADRAGGVAGCQTTPLPATPNSCGRIIFGVIDPSAGLVSESAIVIGNGSFPINVTISPDGQTALVSDANQSSKVFQITAPGTVVTGATPTVPGLPGRQQSIAFSPDGQKAYALSTTPSPHQLSWLQVNSAGNVTLGGAGVATLLTSGNANRVMGVDVVAVTPDGSYALIGNPSLPGDTSSPNMSLVNLSTFAVSTVTTNSNYPMGVGIFSGVATLTTSPITEIATTTATGGGDITSDAGRPVTDRGVCWSTSANPTTADTCTHNGTGTGTFVSSLTSLTPGTGYHVRAYATNSAGTAYGNDAAFTALANLATLTTTAISGITTTTATGGGNITSDGGASVTARGVCWSTSPNPTAADTCTSDGSGIGTFTSSLTSLIRGTGYHVRAYATNTAGTAYGNDVPFSTLADLASLTTTAISGITATTANGGGNITSDGGALVTVRGVCWSMLLNPTTADTCTSDGSGIGTFTSSLTNLTPSTGYHVRAYATNSAGTAYGADVPFTTSSITLPILTTGSISNITATTATGGGNITSDGGALVTARGVCWSTSPNPTTANAWTNNGTGTGPFTSSLTGLTPGMTYHLRAYATNSAGTGYGDDVMFSALIAGTASIPTLNEWGMIFLAFLTGLGSIHYLRRNKAKG